MIEHPQFPFPDINVETDNYSNEVEAAAWMLLQGMQDEWLELCRTGGGTGGLREAANALRDIQRDLEREMAHRELISAWTSRDAPPEDADLF